MSIRIRTQWFQEGKRSPDEVASALAFILWKIGMNALLELENEGFVTHSNAHRLEIMGEFLAFLLQVSDRLVYAHLEQAERQLFINALAKHTARSFVENKQDLFGPGDYLVPFIELINQRAEEYAPLSFVDGEAKLDFLRHFGLQLEAIIGDSDNKHWLCQHVIELDGPQALKPLRRAVADLFEE